jgi:hypothetical protein
MKLRRRLALALCVVALGLGFAGCTGAGYSTGVYVGVSGPGPYWGGGPYGGPYGGGYWGPGRVGGGVVITGRPW